LSGSRTTPIITTASEPLKLCDFRLREAAKRQVALM
jgi:hypothetical protein